MSSKQFAVIGLGHFGSSIAKTLYSLGNEVLVIDDSEDRVKSISDHVTHAVQADATDENVLRSLGIKNFDIAVVSIGSDIQSSIMITLLLKEAGVKYVVARASNELHASVLYKVGADRVVLPERDLGIKTAHSISSDSVFDYIQLSPEYSILEISAIPEWEDKTLSELNIRAKYGINVIAIKRDKDINVSPRGEDLILPGDILVVIGSANDLSKISKTKI